MTHATTLAPSTVPRSTRWQRIGILASVLLGTLLAALDQTIVGTAMPRIIAQLQGLDRYAWVFTAYMLAETAGMPIWGKLSDLYGRKWFYLGSIALFLVGSLLSGAAQSINQLIACRALQGLGAGAILPIAQAIIADVFAPAERARYSGMTIAMYGLASIVGPALGGYITDTWSWRWIFYLNLPVGLLTLAVVCITLPHSARAIRRKVDFLGAALLIASLLPLLLALTWGGSTYAWLSAQILSLLTVSAVVLAVFFVVERRAPEPIVPLSLFGNGIFAISALAMMLASMGLFGATLYNGLFVQGVLGQSATDAGVLMTPMMLGVILSSIVSGQVVSRWGRYRIVAVMGMSIAAAGMLLLARMDATTTMTSVTINLVIFGLGTGMVMPLFPIIVQNAVKSEIMGAATAALSFFRALGGTVGVALLGSLLNSTFARLFAEQLPPAVRASVGAGRLAALNDPAALLSSQALERLKASFAQFGPQGQALLAQVLDTI